MFGGPEGMVLLVLVLVLFGGSQLPKLARNFGLAQKEFKDGLAEANRPEPKPDPELGSAEGTPASPEASDVS